MKTEVLENYSYLSKKLKYPYEYFNNINEYRNPVKKLEKEDLFSKTK